MKFNLAFFKKQNRTLVHVLAWLIVFSLPIIFALQGRQDEKLTEHTIRFTELNTIMTIFWLVAFYLNTMVLIPKYLYQKKIWSFVAIQVIILSLILLFNRIIYGLLNINYPYNFNKAILFNGIIFLFFVITSIASKAAADQIKNDQLVKEKEKENLKTELNFLRSQISPHFLFNVLNNLVGLVRLKSDELEPAILKLSSLMQYMLYETDDEKVLIKSEVDYLKSYIDLQKLRFGERLKLEVDINIEEDWHTVEPMLLIPFVENAFKHGTGMVEDPTIQVSLHVKDNCLNFSVKNKYIEEDGAKDNVSGIGLSNVNRRLELLYNKNFTLQIDTSNGWFTAVLNLTLDS